MGNRASHAAESEWKGPFSDEEYAQLASQFRSVSQSKEGAAPSKLSLHRMLRISTSETIPAEWQIGISRLPTAFAAFCLSTRESDSTDASASSNAKTSTSSDQLQLADFVRGVAACTRASSQAICRALFQLFVTSKETPHVRDVELYGLFLACLVMANDKTLHDEPKALVAAARSLGEAAMTGKSTRNQLSMTEFVDWTSAQTPLLYSAFASWMASRCIGPSARLTYHPPVLSHKSDILSLAQITMLSWISAPLQNGLDRIYTTTQDGLSFNRLNFHVLGYDGPTLVVIRDTDGDVFGMYCDAPWRESSKFIGGSGCFLFRMAPSIGIYQPIAPSTHGNFMYLNTKGVALPRGIGMGGTVNGLRLFLNEDFDEGCYTAGSDTCFQAGRLSSRDQFFVEALEVWGCAGIQGLQRQREFQQETAKMLDKMRKVDKAAFVGNDFDREHFLGKTFGHGTDRARIVDDVDADQGAKLVTDT